MKIQIASDLHLEFRPGRLPAPADFRAAAGRSVLVLAGDIGVHLQAAGFILEECRRSPVIYVPGNHEYYTPLERSVTDLEWRRLAAETPHLHYLNGEGVTVDGKRFWGAPWHSDLFGNRDPEFLREIGRSIRDFSPRFSIAERWTVHRHLQAHQRQTEQLLAAGPIDVAVTHWPPIPEAVAPRFKGDMLNAYFVNDREDLVRSVAPQVWISGHVHDPYDVMAGGTRCIGNPCGYPGETRQTRGFKAERVIEIQTGEGA